MSTRVSEKLISSTDLNSKNIYNSPKRANPDLLNKIPFCIPQEKSLPTGHKLVTIAKQNETIARQIQDASRRGDDIL